MDTILERLLDGNRRFASGEVLRSEIGIARRRELIAAQKPFAIILGCCDSRVPPEIIFDCGLGDLFTIRTAGHTIDRAVIESLDYGIKHLHIPLLIVLGHERCGAVSCAIAFCSLASAQEHDRNVMPSSLKPGGPNSLRPRDKSSQEEGAIIEQIRPAIEACGGELASRDEIAKAHVRLTVARLEKLLVNAQGLKIFGAYYNLESGIVEILMRHAD